MKKRDMPEIDLFVKLDVYEEFVTDQEYILTNDLTIELDHPEEMLQRIIYRYDREQAIYDMLSEDDKEAIRIGTELKYKRAMDEDKPKHKHLKYKTFVILAAALIALAGIGITSTGDRVYRLVKTSDSKGNTRLTTAPEEGVSSDDIATKIKKETGTTVVVPRYLPEMAIYNGAYYDNNASYQEYQYGQELFTILSNGKELDAGKYKKTSSVKIKELNITVDILYGEQQRAAIFDYNDIHYEVYGIMEDTEFKSIIESLYI